MEVEESFLWLLWLIWPGRVGGSLRFTAKFYVYARVTYSLGFPQLVRARGLPGWLCLIPTLPGNSDSFVGSGFLPFCYDSNLAWSGWSTMQPLFQSTLPCPTMATPMACSSVKFSSFSLEIRMAPRKLNFEIPLYGHTTLLCGCGHTPR